MRKILLLTVFLVACSGRGDMMRTQVIQLPSPNAVLATETMVVHPSPTVVLTPTPAGTTVPLLSKTVQYGIHVLDPVQNAGLAADLGVSLVKIQVRWSQIQKCGESVDWALIDAQNKAIRDQGLGVVMSVVTAPPCTNSAGLENRPPDDPILFAEFLAQLSARYKPVAIEVWNEANLDREWGEPNPSQYIELLVVSYQAIKTNSHETLVIAGALSPTWQNPPYHWDDLVYWQEFGRLGGSQYADCVGVHINSLSFPPDYNLENQYLTFDHHSWYFPDTLVGTTTATGLPACITEYGIATPGAVGGIPESFGWAHDTSLYDQAAWLIEGMRLAESYGNVKMLVVWNLDFSPLCGGCVDEKSPYSILSGDGLPLPAYIAIRQAMGK